MTMNNTLNRFPKMVVLTALICAALGPAGLVSQEAAETLVIEGGTIHSLAGAPARGRIVVVDGVITAVGAAATAPAGATRIDASGLHVYPGMIDSLSQVGLVEVNAVAATDDQAEMGMYNAHLSAATAIHPSSELIPVTRANGITHAVVAPQVDKGVIAGQASLVHLDGWTVEEMAIDPSIAMVIYWPEIVTRSFDFSTFSMKETPFNDAKEEAEDKQKELRDWIQAARHYGQASAAGSSRLEKDLRLAALAECLDGGKKVLIFANSERAIKESVEFAETEGLDMVLAGGRDAWKLVDLLAEKNIPVVVGLTQSLPNEEDDPYDRPFSTAGELAAAGVKIAFASGSGGGFGPGGPHGSRTTPYEAGMAAAYGLSADDALKAVTIWPAEIFGIGDKLGTIEPGKIGNLIVTDGDPLEITTQIEHLIIGGREVSTNNMHRELYERYRSR